MPPESHRYYCGRCDRFLCAENLASLAAQVNTHAQAVHPTAFANWTAEGVLHSSQYSGTLGAPLPQYLAPHSTTTRRVPVLPDLTDADKAMLAEAHVKWD